MVPSRGNVLTRQWDAPCEPLRLRLQQVYDAGDSHW